MHVVSFGVCRVWTLCLHEFIAFRSAWVMDLAQMRTRTQRQPHGRSHGCSTKQALDITKK